MNRLWLAVFLVCMAACAPSPDQVEYEKKRKAAVDHAQVIFDEIVKKANPGEKVDMIPEYFEGAYIVRNVFGRAEVWVGYNYIFNNSDDALRGLFGHELGHLLAGHLDREGSRSKEEVDRRQAEATAIGACLAGEKAVQAQLADYSKKEEHLTQARSITVTADCRLAKKAP